MAMCGQDIAVFQKPRQSLAKEPSSVACIVQQASYALTVLLLITFPRIIDLSAV